ncbi:MAG: TIR domain-containing protein [Bacteroidales bacterium]|jgi:peptidoglycan hydrolase-like protein with peptidoglycan-binding domain|nr:TIR domain-containing protein [Bacteroidales bacterium]MBR2199654.1 TIR domain-containing protein [Bacteroidales bacterium]
MQYINPDTPVYISYAWANEANPDLEADVNNLCQIMERNGIYYKRDKENLCPYRWSIHKAEEEIGEGCAVIVVVSEKYIKSLHCMHEWHLIRENGKISQRVFPIVMPGADITVKSKYKEYYAFFNQRKQELVEQLAEGIIPLSNSETEAAHFGYYLNDLAALYQYLADYNTAKHVVRENDYAALISQLKSYIGSKSGVEIKPQATNNKRESVYNGLTTHQCQLMQMNLNSTREALLEDEKNNKNSSAAKDFLKSFSAPIETDGIYDESTKNAVIALQTYLSLKIGFTEFITIDGIYGPETEGYYDRWAKKANPNADKKVLDK